MPEDAAAFKQQGNEHFKAGRIAKYCDTRNSVSTRAADVHVATEHQSYIRR